MRSIVKDLIQPILDLVKALVQPQQGTKFLITVAAIGAIVYLHSKGIATTTSDIVLMVIAVIYYLADIFAKTRKINMNTFVKTKKNDNGTG